MTCFKARRTRQSLDGGITKKQSPLRRQTVLSDGLTAGLSSAPPLSEFLFVNLTDSLMFSTPFYKKAAAVFLGLSLASAPVLADDLEVLGQFLQQNLTSDQDPLGTFLAENPDDMLEAQAAIAGPLLSSQAALIVNNRTGEVLYQKNMNRVMPIASISKLMSAMVVLDARLNMNEVITITEDEIDRLKGTGSRLSVGTQLTRAQLLHLSLMSSENRATHALGRTYPGGMSAFVAAMNASR